MKYPTKKTIWWILAVIVFCIAFFSVTATSNRNFIKGKYGHKCYMAGSEHGNIRYPVYFETLEECLKSLATPVEREL